MSLKWTFLATVLMLVTAVGAVVAFEATGDRSSAQRGEFANVVWPAAAGVAVLAWGWFIFRKPGR